MRHVNSLYDDMITSRQDFVGKLPHRPHGAFFHHVTRFDRGPDRPVVDPRRTRLFHVPGEARLAVRSYGCADRDQLPGSFIHMNSLPFPFHPDAMDII